MTRIPITGHTTPNQSFLPARSITPRSLQPNKKLASDVRLQHDLNLKFNVHSVFLVAAPPTFYEGGLPDECETADCATDAKPVEHVVCQTAVESGNSGANSERPDDQRTGSQTVARVGRTLPENVTRLAQVSRPRRWLGPKGATYIRSRLQCGVSLLVFVVALVLVVAGFVSPAKDDFSRRLR